MSPHIASEIFEDYFDSDISQEKWPTFDETKLENPVYELVIQINGKMKHALNVKTGIDEDEVKEICTTNFDIDFSNAKKVIFIKDKLINLTTEAFQKEVFGTPTFIINNKIFWGQDRLEYALDEYNS